MTFFYPPPLGITVLAYMQMLEDTIEVVYKCINPTMLFISSCNAHAHVFRHLQQNAPS